MLLPGIEPRAGRQRDATITTELDVVATRPWVPAEAEARIAPMAGQAVRVGNVSVDKGPCS